jgi:hypothetical protein
MNFLFHSLFCKLYIINMLSCNHNFLGGLKKKRQSIFGEGLFGFFSKVRATLDSKDFYILLCFVIYLRD